jgi:hypothetical protein
LITVPFSQLGFSVGVLMFPLGALASLFSFQLALVIYGATTVFYIAWPLLREARARRESPG